ncbi:hypothetical protein CsSME_00034097 [Camellia sinensis var. sinensis]
MEDNTGSRESKKKSMEDNTRSSKSKEKRRKSMEDNTRSSESKEKRRKSMEDNTRPTENESEEDILDEGDEEADEEHDQEPEVLVQPEPVVNKAPEVSSAPEEETRVYARIVFAQVHSYRLTSRSAPSFFRKAGQGTPHKMNKLHVGATISSQSVPGQNIVLVRPRTLGQTNPTEHNGPVPMEGDEEIFEEEAVCKNCFHNLKEENILKTECKCGNALIHEDCAAKWSRTRGNNNCDSCGQEVQTFPVTLVRGLSSSTQVVGREESNKSSFFSWL